MLEPGKNSKSVFALPFPLWYVAYFCLLDAVILVSTLSYFLSATSYQAVNKPLSSLTEFRIRQIVTTTR